MHILVTGTYENGHQPLHVASAAAALRTAGHRVTAADLAGGTFDLGAVEGVDAMAVAAPMHTALRLAIELAGRVKAGHPELPICFFGLYAAVGAESVVGRIADHVIAGEYATDLVAWADGIAAGVTPAAGVTVSTAREPFPLPDRRGLPPLELYGRVVIDGEQRLVGAVEASRGCSHRCRHCPVPVVYDGRIRIVAADIVLEDIAALVEAGAGHITFVDPDFLNGVHHSLRVVRSMRRRFPDLTFDITTKVEHILGHPEVWPELAASGLGFVISAFETTNDRILTLLDKGHTAGDMGRAVHLLRGHGIEIRPSWLPFTPWTTVDDLVDIADFVVAHDLVDNLDPVQLSIRLLIPAGSLLLEVPELHPLLEGYDPAALGHRWHAADPATEDLQRTLAAIAEDGADGGTPARATLDRMWHAIEAAAGRPVSAIPAGATVGRPRATEPWFC